jgi:hypothetical protein
MPHLPTGGVTFLALPLKPVIDLGLDPGDTVFAEADRRGEFSVFDKASEMNGVE